VIVTFSTAISRLENKASQRSKKKEKVLKKNSIQRSNAWKKKIDVASRKTNGEIQ